MARDPLIITSNENSIILTKFSPKDLSNVMHKDSLESIRTWQDTLLEICDLLCKLYNKVQSLNKPMNWHRILLINKVMLNLHFSYLSFLSHRHKCENNTIQQIQKSINQNVYSSYACLEGLEGLLLSYLVSNFPTISTGNEIVNKPIDDQE